MAVLAIIACAHSNHESFGVAGSETPGHIQFENRQKHSGIVFVLDNGTLPDKPMIDGIPGGVALLDYDNDGYLDIFFTNGARLPSLVKDGANFYNRLYHNNHDGTFTDVTDQAGVRGEGYSIGVAAADYDNDGRTRSLRYRLQPQHSLSQQWGRHIHRCDRQSRSYRSLHHRRKNCGARRRPGWTTTMTANSISS